MKHETLEHDVDEQDLLKEIIERTKQMEREIARVLGDPNPRGGDGGRE